ncbi:unnamed protein product [Mytilus coruscus]|uniref:Uncharacterized protein n=1 Tax=Mytilus coruscus TaxID=42192 RepID=A0A6J8CHY5_MYTCO|nr:unnamed protein product [Mytilus coruscus]
MSDVSNEDDSADNDQDETWTPPSLISENETKNLEATNNELEKKLQNLEGTYEQERRANREAERRADIAEKKLEALQERLERETEENEKLSDRFGQHQEDSNERIKNLKKILEERESNLHQLIDKHHLEQEENRQLQKVISIMTEELEIGKKKTSHMMSCEVNKDILQYVGEKVISNSVLQKYPDVKLKRKSDKLVVICYSQERMKDIQHFLNDMITFAGYKLSWSLEHINNEMQSDSDSSDAYDQTMVTFEMSSDDYDKLQFFSKDDILQHASYDGTNLKLKFQSLTERQK